MRYRKAEPGQRLHYAGYSKKHTDHVVEILERGDPLHKHEARYQVLCSCGQPLILRAPDLGELLLEGECGRVTERS